MMRHASTAEDALCASVCETAGADYVTSGLLAGEGVGDCEGVEDVHF